jgi:cytochrome P450
MFLLAGHGRSPLTRDESISDDCMLESSAHALSFALILLALHPDKQRKLYEEVANVWLEGAPTTGDTSVCMYIILSFCLVLKIHLVEQGRFFQTGECLHLQTSSNFNTKAPQPYTLAAFHEALRHFPPAIHLGKPVTADVSLPVKHFVPKSDHLNQFSIVHESYVPIPAGSLVMIDILGIHMNRMLV